MPGGLMVLEGGPGPPARQRCSLAGAGQADLSSVEEALAQMAKGVGEEPGDVHLRDAKLLADLGLGHVSVEPQQEDLLLASGQLTPVRGDRFHVQGVLDLRVFLAKHVCQAGRVGTAGQRGYIVDMRYRKLHGWCVSPVCAEIPARG